MADLYKTAGADRLMSVDLHTSQEQGFFDGPWDHLWAQPVLVDYIRRRIDTSNAAVVSPDAGRIRVAERWANALGGTPLAFVHKTRDITRPNESVANRVVGAVEGRSCVLVDDMIDTGGTIAKAVQVVLDAGAKDVIVAATHGVLSGPAVDRLSTCGGPRGRRHRHPSDPRIQALREPDRAADRATAGPCHQGGLRRRLGDPAVRLRRSLSPPPRCPLGLLGPLVPSAPSVCEFCASPCILRRLAGCALPALRGQTSALGAAQAACDVSPGLALRRPCVFHRLSVFRRAVLRRLMVFDATCFSEVLRRGITILCCISVTYCSLVTWDCSSITHHGSVETPQFISLTSRRASHALCC